MLQLVIDANALTLGDIEDLENAKKVGQIIAWFVKHAGADEAALRALPIKELRGIVKQVQEKIDAELALPKVSAGS